MNINKQLELIFNKLNEISTNTTSSGMDDWWNSNDDRSKISDIIDLENGGLKDGVVGSNNVADTAITFDKMSGGGLNWALVNSNPSGSSDSETYKNEPRVFGARGESVIPLYNQVFPITCQNLTGDASADLITGVNLSEGGTQTYLPIYFDVVSDGTNKVFRYPTLRFDILFQINSNNSLKVDIFTFDFILHTFQRALDGTEGTTSSKTLGVDSTSAYYSISHSINLKTMTMAGGSYGALYWATGELNLNKDNFLTNMRDNWATYNNVNYPDNLTLQSYVRDTLLLNRKYTNGVGLLQTKFDLIGDNLSASVATTKIQRLNMYLVDKQLNNNGWAISERKRIIPF